MNKVQNLDKLKMILTALLIGFIVYIFAYVVAFKILNMNYLVIIPAVIGSVTLGSIIATEKRR